jgi:tripartite ATP-independent transporter DctM subunit
MSFGAKLRQSAQLIPCALLIIAVIGSMFAGWATATEAAAFGVFGSLVLAAVTRTLSWRSFVDSLQGATRLSCMIMFILAGAAFLTKAMALTGIPAALAQGVAALELGPYGIIAILVVVYVVLGTALDGVSMIVLTTSIVVPMVQQAGFDLIWFGIFIVLLVEIAEITPPVGFNLFVMQTMTGKDQGEVAMASLPFFLMLVLTVVLITLFPVTLVTGLPEWLLAR